MPSGCYPRKSLLERLMTRIVVDDNGCWVWQGSITTEGYGQIRGGGRMLRTHRASYEEWVGPIPEGLQIDHLCRVRACCNPVHLEPVSAKINAERGEGGLATAVLQRAKTHCPQGHPYLGDNLYIHPVKGSRACKTCRQASSLLSRRRKANR